MAFILDESGARSPDRSPMLFGNTCQWLHRGVGSGNLSCLEGIYGASKENIVRDFSQTPSVKEWYCRHAVEQAFVEDHDSPPDGRYADFLIGYRNLS